MQHCCKNKQILHKCNNVAISFLGKIINHKLIKVLPQSISERDDVKTKLSSIGMLFDMFLFSN